MKNELIGKIMKIIAIILAGGPQIGTYSEIPKLGSYDLMERFKN